MAIIFDQTGNPILEQSGVQEIWDETGSGLQPTAAPPLPQVEALPVDPIFGQDILLDGDLQAVVAADGSLALTGGVQTGLQDIRLRLSTRLGTLFFDKAFGALVHDWIHEENTLGNRLSFEAEVARRINRDPRVSVGSAHCRISSWDERGITADASWRFIDRDHAYNLVVKVGNAKTVQVLEDINPL